MYAVTASYGGDSTHHTSSGQSGSINATQSTPPPPPGRASVGHPKVSGKTASLPVTCSGASACTITATLTVVETLKHGKITAVAAKAKQKTTKKTVVIGSATITIAAGATKTVTVTLNAAGKRLLARHHRLQAKLTVTQSGTTTGTTTIALTASKIKKTK